MVSQSKGRVPLARVMTPEPLIHHAHARQATSAHSVTNNHLSDAPHYRFLICFVRRPKYHKGVRLRTRTGLHENRVALSMPLDIALSSQAQKMRFPPAPTQHWAYQASTKGFIVVPFGGFLGPPSETAVLTRILRRRSAFHSISRSQ